MSSKSIIAPAYNVMGLASLGNDDIGEDDVESNILDVKKFIDAATGQTVDETVQLILPGDSYKDIKMIDWILSLKSPEDSTDDLFNDFMTE